MEQVYSVIRHHPHSSMSNNFSEWLSDGTVICSVSNCNTMAFTSISQLNDLNAKWWAFHVYVVDLNIPYCPYKITTHTEEITSLEWDISGSKLLIADVVGNIQIWSMKDYLLSEWVQVYAHTFPGERILSTIWFHNGIKITINHEKKDVFNLYGDKYIHTKFGASVRQFGGKPTEGCLTISSSGRVCCLLFLSDDAILSGTEILGQFRTKLKVVDICYAKNGDFLVVTTNGSVESSIDCFRVTVKVNNTSQEKYKCSITCQPYTSFYLVGSAFTDVTHLKFVLKEAAEAIVIAGNVSGASGSTVELWELKEKIVAIHKMFQPKPNGDSNLSNQLKTVVWQHNASHNDSVGIVSIATPRMSLFDMNPPPSYILVAYRDNTLKCFYRENLQLVCKVNLGSTLFKTGENTKSFGMQKLATFPKISIISDMQFTWSSCALIVIDSLSQIFLYRLSPITDPGSSMTVNYAQTMLEYCLVSGNDWWDIILSLKPNLVDSICEKVTENFMKKQPLAIQQKWLSRFLTLKASLYRCLNTNSSNNNGQCKAGDFYTLIMLNSIATTLKSLLRPRDNHENEGPAENLSMLIQNKGNDAQFMIIDQIMMKSEYKDFCVEPMILQSFQHLHQWIADLTLYLLASLPQQYHQNHYRFPGGGLIFDTRALNTLRELLVIIRFWSLMNSSCLPVFTKLQDNLDVISLLFKLLSKTVICMEQLDEGLIDECCLLPNQVLIPHMDLCLKAIGIASPALFANTFPIQLEYFTEAPVLKYNIKTHLIDGSVNYNAGRRIDVVRYVGLGTVAEDTNNLRSCTRCNSLSLLKLVQQSPSAKGFNPTKAFAATKAWDQRWAKNCLCGGHWRIHKPL